MDKARIHLLKPEADDRSFDPLETTSFDIGGSVSFEGAFVVFLDRKKGHRKLTHCSRILQIEKRLSTTEKEKARAKHLKSPEAVIYYHKQFFSEDYNDVLRARHIGSKPSGVECVIDERGTHWTTFYMKGYIKLVVVPTDKILGIDFVEDNFDE